MFKPLDRKLALGILALVVTLELAGIAVVVSAERSAQRRDDARISIFQKAGAAWIRRTTEIYTGKGSPRYGEKAGLAWRERLAEPILRPRSVAARAVSLAPEEKVIGIVLGSEARAYRFAAFESKTGHLVNDLVGGVPVSVAYCDKTQCLRVYSDPGGTGLLDLNVAGSLFDEMVMRHGDKMYFHKSGKEVQGGASVATIPYALVTPTVTTWREWTARHPDTQVYIGKQEDGPPEESPRSPRGRQ